MEGTSVYSEHDVMSDTIIFFALQNVLTKRLTVDQWHHMIFRSEITKSEVQRQKKLLSRMQCSICMMYEHTKISLLMLTINNLYKLIMVI